MKICLKQSIIFDVHNFLQHPQNRHSVSLNSHHMSILPTLCSSHSYTTRQVVCVMYYGCQLDCYAPSISPHSMRLDRKTLNFQSCKPSDHHSALKLPGVLANVFEF